MGASGDLTARKLIPAIAELHAGGFLPHGFTLVGAARTEMTDDEFQSEGAARRRPTAATGGPTCVKRFRYVTGEYDSPVDLHRDSAKCCASSTTTGGTDGNRIFYLATLPAVFPTIVEHLGSAGLNRPTSRGKFARVVIEKPYGRDLKSAEELDATVHDVLRRVAGVPHRPLPREGDGAERVGVAVRQRDLRTDLEPSLHRQRADHRGRDARRRPSRRLLRDRGRAARHRAEPRAPSAGDDRDGAAGARRTRRDSRREGEGAQGDRRDDARGSDRRHGAGAVQGRHDRRRQGRSATARKKASPTTATPRRTSPPSS